MLTSYDSKNKSGVPIEVAYSELSQEAFAAWIRLHVADKKEMIGRKKMCKILEYSEGRSNVILRELKLKGYLKFIPGPNPGVPTKFLLIKKVLLAGNNQFINLSNHLWLEDVMTSFPDHAQIQKSDNVQFFCGLNSVHANMAKTQFVHTKRTKTRILPDFVKRALEAHRLKKAHRKSAKNAESPSQTNTCSASPSSAVKSPQAKKSVDSSKNANRATHLRENQTGQIPCKTEFDQNKSSENKDLAPPLESINTCNLSSEKENTEIQTHAKHVCSNIDMTKVKAKKQARKQKKSSGKTKAEREFWAKKRQQIDWTKPEPGQKPSITFTPGLKQRVRMVEILERPRSNPERKAMASKLGSEFLRIYSRYRRTREISYATVPKEKKHAEDVAILCIYKKVTPTQLIEYWEEHIGDFTGMKVPSLAFLTSPGNVDRVACEVGINNGKPTTQPAKKQGNTQQQSGIHSYSDVSRLDRRLRPALTEAGFDLKQFDDRYLLTIQSAAKSIAKGFNMFVSSNMKPMVQWAAKNLFSLEEVM